jgi:hypothetical protein
MPRFKIWQGRLKPVPHNAHYAPKDKVAEVMERKYGRNDPSFPEPGLGRKLQEQRAATTFKRLDRLPDPLGNFADGESYRGLKVYAAGSDDHYGRATGVVIPCNKKNCPAHRILVMWPNGNMTQPCLFDLEMFKEGRRVVLTPKQLKYEKWKNNKPWHTTKRSGSTRTGRGTSPKKARPCTTNTGSAPSSSTTTRGDTTTNTSPKGR